MTDLEPTPPAATASPATDSWEALLEAMRRRYPGQRDSVLFCIHKLQQNPDLGLRDFRAEADLHGIPLAGRSLHSARVLLGLAVATKPKAATTAGAATASPAPAPAAAVGRRRARGAATDLAAIEAEIVAGVQRLQAAATAETARLRAAIAEALEVLRGALAGDA
ncbi:MAG: hypothetical protein KF830_13945 [Planctomycetes bacterium]|nr:hypothetical protein [Planctomycetota bacterium]